MSCSGEIVDKEEDHIQIKSSISDKMKKAEPKISRKMGYISNVNDAKENLEKIFKKSPNNPKD